jgi:hypothetical protein
VPKNFDGYDWSTYTIGELQRIADDITNEIQTKREEKKKIRLMRRNVWSSLRRISSGGGVAHLAKAIGNTLHTVGPMSRKSCLSNSKSF